MKKTLLVIMLCLSCLFSFSFAANRTDKYQAIKEWWEYYNKLLEIYQDEDYKSRHSNAVSKCIDNSYTNNYIPTTNNNSKVHGSIPTACVLAYNWDLHELWWTCWDRDFVRKFCENPSNWMTDEEYKIYEFITNEETASTWAILDNECYQSMNWYYDEKENKCLCENWSHLENNVCVKDEVEETKIGETNQAERIEKAEEEIEEEAVEEKVEQSEVIEGNKDDSTKDDSTKDDIPELNQAVNWMYEKWLTIFNEPESFMASRWLRRDEAAKFYVQYAKQVMWKIPDYSKQWCNFKDLGEAWSDLIDIIVESCQLWLFQWNNWNFMPAQQLTNAQAITVFMRLREWYKDETGSHFANNYYESAHAQWFLFDTLLDYRENFDKYTTRWDVAKMLFRWQKTN